MKQLDAVFEGGGVKGIAFVGAISEFEKQGFSWNRVAGTSAGAIIASLLAAGYTAEELAVLMKDFHYVALKKKLGVAHVPLLGPWLYLWMHKGLNNGDYLFHWMKKQLRQKGIETFADMREGKLKITASDITNGRLLVLPDDAEKIGYTPRCLSIALAVRMSASLPFYLQPVILKQNRKLIYIVDGGILSNFPLWIFGENHVSSYPTIGFRLSAGYQMESVNYIHNFPAYVHAMLKTMLMAHDQRYVEKQNAARTVFIPTDGITSSKFDLSLTDRGRLYTSGEQAAKHFLTRIHTLRKPKTS
ncbi:patatin-like phospholipase family protein [Aneurinibacillus terranovensis]|uniref:patatin-like phospholipase family protein n=1 Tax=Aneurinibacillus terranovensis TaxID=278991 RepID=UPI0004060AF8|nr:patatin-like phospholipase family protein [Aneurinibacillus terranovensis]